MFAIRFLLTLIKSYQLGISDKNSESAHRKEILICKQNLPTTATQNQQGPVYREPSVLLRVVFSSGSPESEEAWGNEVEVLRVCRAHRRKMFIRVSFGLNSENQRESEIYQVIFGSAAWSPCQLQGKISNCPVICTSKGCKHNSVSVWKLLLTLSHQSPPSCSLRGPTGLRPALVG